MKQLFIVPNGVTYPTNESTIDKLTNGQLGIYETSGGVPKATVAKVKTSEFILAYGRENSQAITMVINSDADITKITATEGKHYSADITIPTPEKGLNYTVELIRKGVGFNERNLYTATDKVRVGIDTAEKLAKSLANQLNEKVNNGELNLKVTATGAKISITSKDWQDWELSAADDLYSILGSDKDSNQINQTHAVTPTCDADYVKNLASVCAQNRGFNNTYADGASIYPGYPEVVAGSKYIIYNIHFQYGRKASRTRDEAVWQDAIIAVDNDNTTFSDALETVLGLK